ncbi:DNA-3-methyladenine glycosylase family protein [Cellulomonas soli]|uniref:DNA-3-methyladenine glycosylase II n=1 Tax=Cellulomonas soli TaxID=931535 RepID=A0A512P886_9CELL|nr:AlkA N-terminal domain-containing protein [Cellulomonas soli]NYI57639.1 AraC family transcriptional regulator of adaptative response / DNA-3-methyladenine glycosylase II [Cellulomonas soli]GEP67417.1 hypothetical protein CSO01_01320 [Cellulomonas soli]
MRHDVTVPFAAAPALASLAAHAVPGVETVDRSAGTVRRLVDLGEGPVVVHVTLHDGLVSATVDDEGAVHPTRAPAPRTAALDALLRRWFGLDDDLGAVRSALGGDALIGPLLSVRPDLRVLGHPDGFEAAVTTVLGQQVSLAAARTFGGRLAQAYGTPHAGSGLVTYPDAGTIARVDPVDLQAVLRVPHSRARTVHALATACSRGLALTPGSDHAEVRRQLLALPGVGPWTVEYLAVRVLADRDAWPSGDLVLRRALGGTDAAGTERAAEAWRPWRAHAAFHLWTATAYPA